MKCLNSKLITIFICLNLALFPAFTFAGGFGGWTVNSLVAQGASSILTGSKEVILNGAKKVATGTALITPVAADVSKLLLKGAGGVALSFAIEQLLGAVDWVLDPANNQIKYTKNCVQGGSCPDVKYFYMNPLTSEKFANASDACNSIMTYYRKIRPDMYLKSFTIESLPQNPVGSQVCRFSYDYNGKTYDDFLSGPVVLNPNYDPSAEKPEEKTIPLNTVAERLISNAESGNADAQAVTTAAAAQIVADAEKDNVKARPIINQLENTQSIPTDQTAKGDSKPQDTTNTGEPTAQPKPQDITLNFPIFCNWAPSVCQAAKYVITQPQVWADAVSLAWTDFWKEPNIEKDTNTRVDVQEQQIQNPSQFDQNYIQFGGQCPSFETNTIPVGSISVPLFFDLSSLCSFALLVRPAILGLAYFAGMGIVTSAIREL